MVKKVKDKKVKDKKVRKVATTKEYIKVTVAECLRIQGALKPLLSVTTGKAYYWVYFTLGKLKSVADGYTKSLTNHADYDAYQAARKVAKTDEEVQAIFNSEKYDSYRQFIESQLSTEIDDAIRPFQFDWFNGEPVAELASIIQELGLADDIEAFAESMEAWLFRKV